MNKILVINKEANMTSRDVVNIVSKYLNIKKIGHTGTLDPMAEGVLVLTINKACKVASLITSLKKEYIATVKLGFTTDTLDTTGTILQRKEITTTNLEQVLKSYEKTYLQEVPNYSAVKVNGKKLYEYARNNEKVVLPQKEVTIYKIKLLEQSNDTFKFKCLVSKGTYVRSLIRDICNSLNTLGVMSALVRTKQGKFEIEDSYTLADIKNNNYKFISIKDAIDIKNIVVEDDVAFKISNGVKLVNSYNIKDLVLFLDKEDNELAIYQVSENNMLKAYIVF